MSNAFPTSHITDALTLEGADARIDLFELSPTSGGTIYFSPDNPQTWRGRTYEALPCSLTGEEFDLDKTPEPQLRIGQENLDLLAFKGLVFDGHLEGATVVRKRVLLDDLINNRDIKQTTYFRVKRVGEYSRLSINLILSSYSTATKQTLPFRQYLPPHFPYVQQ
jgi:phage-related protein